MMPHPDPGPLRLAAYVVVATIVSAVALTGLLAWLVAWLVLGGAAW